MSVISVLLRAAAACWLLPEARCLARCSCTADLLQPAGAAPAAPDWDLLASLCVWAVQLQKVSLSASMPPPGAAHLMLIYIRFSWFHYLYRCAIRHHRRTVISYSTYQYTVKHEAKYSKTQCLVWHSHCVIVTQQKSTVHSAVCTMKRYDTPTPWAPPPPRPCLGPLPSTRFDCRRPSSPARCIRWFIHGTFQFHWHTAGAGTGTCDERV